MKLSQLNDEEIDGLTAEEIGRIIYDNLPETEEKCDYGIVLGSKPHICRIRAEKAAELYLNGKISRLICTGGVKWETDEGRMYESEILRNVLLENGVPPEDVVVERRSKTTKENMIYALRRITRCFNTQGEIKVLIITSRSHIRRSVALARKILPPSMKIYGAYPEISGDSPTEWMNDSEYRERIPREVFFCMEAVKTSWMDDIEY